MTTEEHLVAPPQEEGKQKKPDGNSLKQYQAQVYADKEPRWLDGFGYPAGHVKVASHGRTIVGKKVEGRKIKSRIIASSIIIPNESCVLEFKVSGEFDIGITEEGKRRLNDPTPPPIKKPKHIVGMSYPSFDIKGNFSLDKLGRIRELRYDSPKEKRQDTKENRTKFFNPQRLARGSHKLQIIIDRDESTMTFAIDGLKSKKSLYRGSLSKQESDQDFRIISIWCVMRTKANASITYIKPEWDRMNFLFTGQNCPSSYGNLPFGLFRDIAAFI